jgi:hypothetical protein
VGFDKSKAVAAYLKGLDKGFSSGDKYDAQYLEGYRFGIMIKKNQKGTSASNVTVQATVFCVWEMAGQIGAYNEKRFLIVFL